MSNILADLLGMPEPKYIAAIEQFEAASGKFSTDVRLIADIVRARQLKYRELGLDAQDTTGHELYRSLINMIARHDEFLHARLGGSDPTNPIGISELILSILPSLDITTDVWAMKKSVIKKLLKNIPPKATMKRLRYRSVDSMLKRQNPLLMLAYARLIESQAWQEVFLAQYRSLKSSDFEIRPIEFVQLEQKFSGDDFGQYIRRKRHNVIALKEAGFIGILPLREKKLPGLTLNLLSAVVHYVNEISAHASYFKSLQAQSQLGQAIERTLAADMIMRADFSGYMVTWRTIHRHLHDQASEDTIDMFGPYMNSADFIYTPLEEILYRLEPALYFWRDADYAGEYIDGVTVPFNIRDMAINYTNNFTYGHHAVHNMRSALWQTLLLRYMRREPIERLIMRQVENQIYDPGILSVRLTGVG